MFTVTEDYKSHQTVMPRNVADYETAVSVVFQRMPLAVFGTVWTITRPDGSIADRFQISEDH